MRKWKRLPLFLFFCLISFYAKGQYSYVIKHSIEFYGSNALYDISASGRGLLTEIGDDNGLSSSGQIVFTSNTQITEVFVTLRTDNCGSKRISIPISTPRCNLSEEYFSNCADEIDIIYFGFFEVIKPELIANNNNDLNSRDICDSQEFLISNLKNSCTRVNYAVDYFIGSSTTPKELLKYQSRSEYFSFIPSNIPELKPDDLLRIQIRFTEDASPNSPERSPEVRFNILDCSIQLRDNDPIQYTNATCNNNKDGTVTLNFKNNVGNGFEMRYFIFQGEPTDFNGNVESESKNDFPNEVFDEVRYSPPGPNNPNGLGNLVPNGDGTFRGTYSLLEGINRSLNPPLGEENIQNYYIVYQEVRYDFPNEGDVDVKSGEITPKFTIESPSEVKVSIDNIIQPSCAGETGKVTLSATGGQDFESGSYEYSLDGGNKWHSNPTFTNLLQGQTYTFSSKLLLDDSECISTNIEQIVVNEVQNPIAISSDSGWIQQPSNPTATDGSLRVITNNGTLNFNYELFDSNNLKISEISGSNKAVEDFTGLSAGSYYVVVTDIIGCSDTSQIIVLEAIPVPQLGTPIISEITCPGNTNGTINIPISGGTVPYTYKWYLNGNEIESNTTTNDNIENSFLGAGDYELVVASIGIDIDTNSMGTVRSGIISLTEPESVIIHNTNATPISCIGAANGNIIITASGGTSYEYKLDFFDTWTPLNNGTIPITSGGFYDVYLRNENNCESDPVLGILISEPDELTVSTTSQNATTNGGNQGSITLTIVGGTPFSEPADPYTITWTRDGQPFTPPTGSTSSNLINLEAGEYIAQITDANGCSPIINPPITIDEPGPLGITSLTSTPVLCMGEATGSITAAVTGVAPFNFIWERQDGQPITSPNTPTIANLAEGIYILRLTDASGDPEVNDTFTITEPLETLDAIAVPTAASCYGGNDGSIKITALGGTAPYEYAIDNGFGFQISNTFNDLAPRTYVVTVRDNNLCEFTTTVEIIEPLQISVTESILNVTSTGGSDGSITLDVSGGTGPYAYSWTGPGITIPRTNKDIDVLVTGNYKVEITSPGNQGGIDGCYHSQTFFVPEPGPLSINNIAHTDVSCFGEANGGIATTVTGEGTIIYEWTFADGSPILISNGTNGPEITGIGAGSYMLTVTDDNTTTSSAPIIINQPTEALSITNVITTDVNCFEGVNGSVQIEAQGGTGAYTYSLDGVTYQNSPIFNGLAQGSITAYVRDDNNCDFIYPIPVVINEPLELSFVIDLQQPLSAANAADGAITITASGGTGNLSYNWTGPTGFTPINSNVLENLPGGDYLVTITDENYALNNGAGCILVSQQPITIAEPGQLILSLNQTVFLECNGDDFAEITANVQGGVAPYTFEWFRTENGNDIQLAEDTEIIGNLTAGTYFMKATDTNNITVDATSIIIDQPDLLKITEDSITDVLCSGTGTGSIAISVQGGTLPYTYEWSNGAVSEDLTNIAAGEYSVLIFDDNGCLVESTFIVGTPDDALQIVDTILMDVSEYQANDGSIALEVSGGSEPYTIAWTRISDGQNVGDQTTLTNLAPDSYEVLITDANGCTVTEIYEVVQPDIVEETIIQPTCAGESNGSIEVLVNQGNGVFTYSWSTGETTSGINGLGGGSYSVTITGFGDGPIIRSYIILDPLPLEVNLGEDRTLCAGQELVLNATADNANATYNWTSDNGFSSSESSVTINESGNYSVVVTNQNGCMATGSIFVDVTDDEINAEFAVSSQVFVGESLIAVDISYPLPETQEWILPEDATILKQDSDEAEMVFNAPGEYEIGIITQIGECFAKQTKKVLVTENEVLTSGDGQADPRKLIEDFIIYPNPTDGKFTADIVLSERGNISIKIFNFANNALMASKKDWGASSYSIPFDISGLPSGVYAVLLETPYGNSLRKVILK